IRVADDLRDAIDLADDRHALGHARFEELLDAREAHRDVLAHGRDATGVERAHRELRARLADGLGGDDADRFAGVHELAAREVASVAGAADAVLRVAAERRAHANALHAGLRDRLRDHLVDLVATLHDGRAGLRMLDLLRGQSAEHAVLERLDDARLVGDHEDAVLVTAVFDADDDVLRHVHQTAGEVAGVGGPNGSVSQTLAATVRRDEVLEDRQALAEVRTDRKVDDPALRVGDETAHATDLTHLLRVTTRAGRGHHVDGATLVERAHHRFDDVPRCVRPALDRRLVALLLGDEAALELPGDVSDLLFRRRDHRRLLSRDGDVVDRDGNARDRRGRDADG